MQDRRSPPVDGGEKPSDANVVVARVDQVIPVKWKKKNTCEEGSKC